MKDFVSRLTFGFLMAQLFPGAVAVFAITFAYLSFEGQLPNGVLGAVERVLDTWESGSFAEKAFLAGLLVAFGMLIHGVHWTVLGTLEHERRRLEPPPDTMFDFPRDHMPLGAQLLVAPLRAMYELWLVIARPNVRLAAIRENVAAIRDPWMKQHEFMQDFYLYTAQFYAHTAYALLICLGALVEFVVRHDPTWRRAVLLALLYFASATFFLLSRIQFATLFTAEQELIERGQEPPPPALAAPSPPRQIREEYVVTTSGRPTCCTAITSTLHAFLMRRG